MQNPGNNRKVRHNLWSIHHVFMILLLFFLLLLVGCNATGKAYQQTSEADEQNDCGQCITESLNAEQARIGTLEITNGFSVNGKECTTGQTLTMGDDGQWECVALFTQNTSSLRECNFFELEAGDGQQTCLRHGYSLCMVEQYEKITRYYDSVGAQCQGLVQIEIKDSQQGPCPTSSTEASGCYVNQEGAEPFAGDVSIITARGSNSQVLCCR